MQAPQSLIPHCAPHGELHVAEVAGHRLLAVNHHVAPQGLVVLEALGGCDSMAFLAPRSFLGKGYLYEQAAVVLFKL